MPLSSVGVTVVCNVAVPRTRWVVGYFSDCQTAAQRRGSSGIDAIGGSLATWSRMLDRNTVPPSAPELTFVRIVVVPPRAIFLWVAATDFQSG